MKLYAPAYYSRFACIADRCTHTCCVGWEIDVDEQSLQTYSTLSHPYGRVLRESISTEGTPHFRLGEGERCPHLEPGGLCRLILELGEEALCRICREHPRFYNDTSRGREVGLGMACEEACRLILTSDDYDEWIVLGEVEGTPEGDFFDALPYREIIFGILREARPYGERLQKIEETFGVSPAVYSDGEWRALLESLEYMDEAHRAWGKSFSMDAQVPSTLEPALERALAYFVYRHVTEAWDETDFCARLGGCLVLERLLASLAAREGVERAEDLIPLARALSEELEYSEENTEILRNAFLGEE